MSRKAALIAIFVVALTSTCSAFLSRFQKPSSFKVVSSKSTSSLFKPSPEPFGKSLVAQRSKPLRDLLGLGPAEIAVAAVVALVLFGPETLKSLSKDMGRAAAELKEIPKTFKEGMDEGAESSQVAKMKAIAAEKRKKRDAKLGGADGDKDDYEDMEDA
jgi:Sec-independent protein translocase protein TatA